MEPRDLASDAPQPREGSSLTRILAQSLGAGVALVTLISCAASVLPQERALPESPAGGTLLAWSDAQERYVAVKTEEYPIEVRSFGCVTCHVGQHEPHPGTALESAIGCTDCHGGVGWITPGP